MINMEYSTVYHRADPRCGQKSSRNATATGDREPMDLPLPNFYYKKSIRKRKSDDAPDSVGSCQYKRPCIRPEYPITKKHVLSLKRELGWLRQQETQPYMSMQPWPKGDLVWTGCDVTKKQRADIVSWLIDIHQSLRLERNTLFVAVNLLDRYIQKGSISFKALKPLSLSCLWIASKVSEQYRYIPSEKRLIQFLDPGYTLQDFRACERMVLRGVDFHLWRPTALEFALKYLNVLKPDLIRAIKEKMYSALELCLRDINMSFRHPSEVAIAALSYALGIDTDKFAPVLQDISGYKISRLPDIVIHVCTAAYNAYQTREADPIYKKYPRGFSLSDNVYLHVRVMSGRK